MLNIIYATTHSSVKTELPRVRFNYRWGLTCESSDVCLTRCLFDGGTICNCQTSQMPLACGERLSKEKEIFNDFVARVEHCVEMYPASALSIDLAIRQREERSAGLLSEHDIAELISWNAAVSNDDLRVAENIRALLDPETLVIATGQQAGLFLGPLYTVYKTLTAILLAEHIGSYATSNAAGIQRKVVPLFWIASEDSDFEEVRHVDWLDRDGELRRFSYEPKMYHPGTPIFSIGVEPSLRDFLKTVAARTFETEFKQGILDDLSRAIDCSKDLEELFARLMARLFSASGLILVSPRLRFVKRLARSVFEKEIRNPGASSALIRNAAVEIKARGYKPTLSRREGDVNFFLLRDGIRHKVEFRKSEFSIVAPPSKKSVATFSESEMLAILAEDESALCTNVVTRALVEDFIFPTVAYVAGPGEISYFAQLGEVYKLFGLTMPQIYPRARVLLLEPRIERALERRGCSPQEACAVPSRLVSAGRFPHSRLAANQRRIARSIARIEAELESLDRALSTSAPEVRKALEKTKRLILESLGKLQERCREIERGQDVGLARDVAKIRNSILPYGKEQERVLNVFAPFLFNYGMGLLDFLRTRISLDNPAIQIIYLSEIKNYGM
jgi:bacillithiol biosynthesis cysteine-adding enzyme BshC